MNLRVLRAILQVAVAVGLVVVLWRMSDGEALKRRLTGAEPVWVAAGLLCATAALGFGAMRWRYTARRVGVELSVRRSVREFYMAGFLNQVLPGGVVGDALRGWRHGRRATAAQEGSMGPALRAVVIERLGNLMVMSMWMLASMALWPWMPGAFTKVRIWMPLVAAAVVVGGALVAIAVLARRRGDGQVERFFRDSRQALLSRRTFPAQLGFGLGVTGSCVAMFYCAAHAVHAQLSLFHLLALVPGSMFAMSIPISIAGWGLREASAVALWSMAGLPPGEAMASSVLYGILALFGSLPGAVVLAIDR